VGKSRMRESRTSGSVRAKPNGLATRPSVRALAGPGATRQEEQWLNYLVRDASGEMLGRLEATVHHGLAEVACLFAPKHWGRGIGTTAVHWLQGELARVTDVTAVWATTAPSNVRSQRLLDRCGYERASAPSSLLYSYESGDLVYRRQFAFQRQVGADGKA